MICTRVPKPGSRAHRGGGPKRARVVVVSFLPALRVRAACFLGVGEEGGGFFVRARSKIHLRPGGGAGGEKDPPVAAPFAEDRDLVDDPVPVRWRQGVAV